MRVGAIGSIGGADDEVGTKEVGGRVRPVTRHKAPLDGGPTASPLIHADDPDAPADIAVVHVELPPGGGMPEHDHGASAIVLIPLSGSVEVRQDGRTRALAPGGAAHVARGERVALANPGADPAVVMVVATPAEFAGRVAKWPVV